MKNKNKDNNEGEKKLSYIFTRETMGMTILLFCTIVFIMLLTGSSVFAGIGRAVCTFLYGTFGYGSWLVIAALAYFGEWLVFEKTVKISAKKALTLALTMFLSFLLIHTIFSDCMKITLDSYGSYISACYKNAQNGYSGYTFGGVISALVVYPFAKLSYVAAYIILSLLVLASGYLTYLAFRKGGRIRKRKSEAAEVSTSEVTAAQVSTAEEVRVNTAAVEPVPEPAQPVATVQQQVYAPVREENKKIEEAPKSEDKFSQKNLGRKILFENGEFAAESYRRNMIFNENSYFNRPSAVLASEADYLSSFSNGKPANKTETVTEKSYSESYREEIYNKPAQTAPSSYVYGDKPVTELDGYEKISGDVYPAVDEEPALDIPSVQETPVPEIEEEDEIEDITYEESLPEIPQSRDSGYRSEAEENYERVIKEEEIQKPEPEEKKDDDVYNLFGGATRGERTTRSNANLFDDDEEENLSEDLDVFGRKRNEPIQPPAREVPDRPSVLRTDRLEKTEKVERVERADRVEKPVEPPVAKQEEPQEEKPKHVWKKYVRPSLDLLDDYPENANINTAEIEDSKRIIVETLERFKIECEVSNVTIGPAITRYDVIIADKTNIKRSLNYRDAIAMELRKENVTAYLNYAKGALSIEVPNATRTVVGLKGMLASSKFINCKQNSLTFALGKNVEGEVVCPDITKMPHLLVAGTTGSGKSICLSALLVSLLYKYGPEELRLILVDPKQVEFISYDKLPHLMINEILYECDKAIKALNWAIKEMERRYTLFKDMTEAGTATKNLDEYNAHLPAGEEKLPKIVIVLDEFGDLMLQAKKDIESRIIKLVQKARACGIHLILATQRPSVDCITGLIKSNLPTRIGFKVNSFDDARTIFDIGGAEKLLGKGDMYFRSAENPELTRIQGCFVDTHEVQRVTDFVKANNETYFDQSVSDFINTVEKEETQNSMSGEGGEESAETKIDDTFIKALKYCVTSNQASVSMIQRRFPVGYIKACKIIDWMENMNYITQSEGSKPRKVLLTKEEFERIYGDDIDD